MLLGLMMSWQHLHLLTCTLRVAAHGSHNGACYRGRDATEQKLLRLLIGRHVAGTHK
jgi:hypothetical protein